MKLTKILPLLPTITLLVSCSQTEIKVPANREQLVSASKTEAPVNFVGYPDDRPSIAQGKLVFNKQILDGQSCASCHGSDGNGARGPALADREAMSARKPVDLYQFLTYGKNGSSHPALKNTLRNAEIWNLVFYTKSLAMPPLSVSEMSIIDPVFGSNCAVCHGTKGDGDGPLARNLEPAPANFQTFRRFYDRSDDVLYDHIARGIKWEGMPNFLGKQDRKKNFKFNDENINKLVQYVRHFHVSNEGT
jgi:mono/diheme cytochrome c family protein